jgi:hypothetical protein
MDEQLAMEAELAPGAVKEHYPSAALELPGSVRVGQTTQGATRAPTPAPAAPEQPRPRRRNRRRNQQNQQNNPAPQLRQQQQGDASPIQINPLARSVNVERTE